ncbi:MAG: aromatic ring-hydroxylating dioxygenase subunit alpha [Chloroflexales bacterium]|nr:aromatic ring-hydroxylating dioxygenase subunit alpha [Chloroflexales bacterium]
MQDQLSQSQLVSTLPGSYYYAPEIYARELERIFGQMWVCVERAEQLKQAGDYITVDVGAENLIIVRGRDQQLRAFYNACRHRGARVCVDACGNAKALTCKYHAWTYGLDGRLQGAPNIASFGTFPREEFGLLPVALEVWEGLIWVNLADSPPPLAAQLHPPLLDRFGDLEQFARYGIGGLTLGKRIAYDVQSNWKLVVENFMECYHCAPMHPELCELLPAFYNGTSYQGIVGVGTAFADDVEQFSMSGKGNRPRLSGLRDDDDRTYFGLTLAPNVLVSLLPDHVIIHTAHPRGPAQTYVTCDWLFEPGVVAAADFDPSDTVQIFDLVNRQDWEVCELTQGGVRSKAFAKGGVYVPSEHHILQFNNLVRERLGVPVAE